MSPPSSAAAFASSSYCPNSHFMAGGDFIGGKTSASAYGVHGAQPGIGRRDKEAFGIRTVEHT